MNPTLLERKFRADQIRLSRDVTRELVQVAGSLNMFSVDASAPGWLGAVESVVSRGYARSVSLGSQFYEDAAAAVGVSPRVAPVVSQFDVESLRGGLVLTGPYAAKKSMSLGRAPQEAFRAVLSNTTGLAVKTVLSGGRGVVQATARRDPKCIGYARVVSGSPCDFCAMLAGNTYKSLRSASESSGTRTRAANPQPARTRYHSHCKCTVVPIFSQASWPTGYEDRVAQYARAAAESAEYGGGQRSIQERFRAALEKVS